MPQNYKLVTTQIAYLKKSIMAMDINKRLNHLAISGQIKEIYIMELNNYQIIQVFVVHGNRVVSLTYSKDDILFAVTNRYLEVFEYHDSKYHNTRIILGEEFIMQTVLMKNYNFFSVIDGNTIYIYNYLTQERKKIELFMNTRLSTMTVNTKEDLLIVGGFQGIYFFDLKNQRIIKRKPHQIVYKLKFSNNSQLYAYDVEQSLKIKSLQTEKILRHFKSDIGPCSLCQKFTHNDNFLVLSGAWNFRIYNVKYGKLEIYNNHFGCLYICQFYKDDGINFYCGSQNGALLKCSNC